MDGGLALANAILPPLAAGMPMPGATTAEAGPVSGFLDALARMTPLLPLVAAAPPSTASATEAMPMTTAATPGAAGMPDTPPPATEGPPGIAAIALPSSCGVAPPLEEATALPMLLSACAAPGSKAPAPRAPAMARASAIEVEAPSAEIPPAVVIEPEASSPVEMEREPPGSKPLDREVPVRRAPEALHADEHPCDAASVPQEAGPAAQPAPEAVALAVNGVLPAPVRSTPGPAPPSPGPAPAASTGDAGLAARRGLPTRAEVPDEASAEAPREVAPATVVPMAPRAASTVAPARSHVEVMEDAARADRHRDARPPGIDAGPEAPAGSMAPTTHPLPDRPSAPAPAATPMDHARGIVTVQILDAAGLPQRLVDEAMPPPSSVAALPSSPARQIAPIAVALAFTPGGTGGFHLTLEPMELGRVEIRVQREGESHAIQVVAERPETLALLQRDRQELDRGLSDAGLQVNSGGIDFSLAASPGRSGEGEARHRFVPLRDAGGGQAPVMPEREPPPPRVARGLLDLHI